MADGRETIGGEGEGGKGGGKGEREGGEEREGRKDGWKEAGILGLATVGKRHTFAMLKKLDMTRMTETAKTYCRVGEAKAGEPIVGTKEIEIAKAPYEVREAKAGKLHSGTKEMGAVKTRDETRKAIVVGASSGIGREMCRLLLADGWRIGIAARREEKLEEIRNMNPEMVEVAALDVTAEDCTRRLAELMARLGGMELYFHISGVGHQNKELEPSVEEKTVATNALGFTRMIDYVFNLFAKQGYGHIAVISSIAGTRGLGSCPSYSATKAYQSTYIESLEQLSSIRRLKNIRFTDIRPGFIMTDLIRDGQSYPMVMPLEYAAPRIYKAVMKGRHNVVIDWRWAVAVFLWRLIPRPLWRRWRLVSGSLNPSNTNIR